MAPPTANTTKDPHPKAPTSAKNHNNKPADPKKPMSPMMQHWLNERSREGPWSGVARLGGTAGSKQVDPKGKIWYEDGMVLEVAVMADPLLCRSARCTRRG